MASSIFCCIHRINEKLDKMDSSIKASFSNVKRDVSSLTDHIRYSISKLTEQEKLNKQITDDIAELKRIVDIDSIKRLLKEETMRDIHLMQDKEKPKKASIRKER